MDMEYDELHEKVMADNSTSDRLSEDEKDNTINSIDFISTYVYTKQYMPFCDLRNNLVACYWSVLGTMSTLQKNIIATHARMLCICYRYGKGSIQIIQ